MKSKRIVTCLLMFSLFYFACSNSSNPTGNTVPSKDTTIVKTEKTHDTLTTLQNIANFIAGMPIDSTASFYGLTKTTHWINYSKLSEKAWHQFDSSTQKPVVWSKAELAPLVDTFKTLYYPFSGPDILYANIFFPHAEKIFMIGLEEPGNIPSFNNVKSDSLRRILNLYRASLDDIMNASFFRTKDMRVELGNATIDGTTPIFMLFLARTGKDIIGVKKMKLNHSGKLVYCMKNEKKDSINNRAVEISYRNHGDSTLRYIYFLSTNVADPALQANKPFYLFLQNLPKHMAGYIKSASYVMHKSYFSIIRNSILNKTDVVLQDDSGIAFKYWDQNIWNIQLYGSYTKPIPLFAEFFEQDLFNAYKSNNVKKINFRIGYHPQSNMLLATRRK